MATASQHTDAEKDNGGTTADDAEALKKAKGRAVASSYVRHKRLSKVADGYV